MAALKDARGIGELQAREDDVANYEPGTTYDGKTFAERLLTRKPPGDAPDPREHGRWRAA